MRVRDCDGIPVQVLGSGGWDVGPGLPSVLEAGEAPVLRRVNVAIVGAGPSGLVAGYRLRDDDVLLLEAENEVGGNARVGYWNGMPWPMGAIVTYERSPAMELYEELGLSPRPADSSYGRTSFLGDRRAHRPLWEGGLEDLLPPEVASGVRKAGTELAKLDLEAGRKELDRRLFSRLLEPYRPEVAKFYDSLLRWFGGSARSYSAYVGAYLARSQMGEGLGVLYPERTSQGGAYSFPGGLGRATRALAQAIEEAGNNRVWTECTVTRVTARADGVTIRAVRDGSPVTVRAEAVILAVPKVVARRVVARLPTAQRSAMERFRYVPFLVAGIVADGEIAPDVPVARILDGPPATFRHVTSQEGRHLYRCEIPVALDAEIQGTDPESVCAQAGKVVDRLEAFFPGARDRIAEFRVWRRGRNWYVPVPEMVTDFQPEAARPAGRVCFACADSLGPVSEFGWAMLAADRAVKHTRRLLAG